ncbi:MAG: molecular chaperone TorD family protein [Magnetococcales bacterium]|nr:molecular chaperone TorD family protein [Magnetococcales bacterium]
MNDHQDVSQQPLVTSLRRVALYRTLARGFFYPSGEVCMALEKLFTDLMATDFGWPSGLAPLTLQCAEAFRKADRSELEGEYFRLFGPAAKAPPIETAYGNAYRLLGKAANISDISGFYHAFGVKAPGMDAGTRENMSEDHLAMELEFMSLLNAKESLAIHEEWQEELEITRDAMVKFLREHLGAWLEPWHRQLMEANPHEFYAHLATTLLAMVQSDLDRLGIQPEKLTERAIDTEVGGDELICPMAAPASPE